MSCDHAHMIKILEPVAHECKTCAEQGDTWVHLRMCMTCGYVGGCDSSKNMHARKHYLRNDHPIIRSIEPQESWRYCYTHNKTMKS